MSLQLKLRHFKENFQKQAPVEVFAQLERATEELEKSGILEKVPTVGQKLPDFILPNQDGKNIALSDLRANGPVILNFFRGVWCPYCNIELEALQENAERIESLGARLVVISPQNQSHALKTKKDNQISFDVLVDAQNDYAKHLNLAFTLPKNLQSIYSSFGIDLRSSNGDSSWTLPMPARILIDRNGTVRYANIHPDYTTRPEVEDVLSVLKAMKL